MHFKRVAILQSSYIPWKGYFDIINQVDEFIIYDDTQYTRRDWRTRNKIKTKNGLQWLTIPVQNKGKYTQNICETKVVDSSWAQNHWQSIYHAYRKLPGFQVYGDILEKLYQESENFEFLSEINELFIKAICGLLNIHSKITHSSSYGFANLNKTERLVALCQKSGASFYLSGPSAQNYIDPTLFQAAEIQLEYINYDNYPEYQQCHPPFEHHVSIIDLLLNTGSQAINYLQSNPDE